MMTAIFSLVFAFVGGALYAISQNPKVVELARLLFFAGVLALALTLSAKTFSL